MEGNAVLEPKKMVTGGRLVGMRNFHSTHFFLGNWLSRWTLTLLLILFYCFSCIFAQLVLLGEISLTGFFHTKTPMGRMTPDERQGPKR